MVQSDQLTKRIPNYSPNNIGIGQQNDNDYPDHREDYLYHISYHIISYIHLLIIQQMIRIQIQIITHAKDREKCMHQRVQVEKS